MNFKIFLNTEENGWILQPMTFKRLIEAEKFGLLNRYKPGREYLVCEASWAIHFAPLINPVYYASAENIKEAQVTRKGTTAANCLTPEQTKSFMEGNVDVVSLPLGRGNVCL